MLNLTGWSYMETQTGTGPWLSILLYSAHFKKMISLFTKPLQLLGNLSAVMNRSVQRKEH